MSTPSPPRFLAASYSLSDGFGLLARLELHPDGSFHFVWNGCTGLVTEARGRYVADRGVLRLEPSSEEFRQDPRSFAHTLHRVRWGEREYLLADERMLAFVNAVNAGTEPRSGLLGVFYLRDGDEKKAVSGVPSLEGGWARYLLPEPVAGVVTGVAQQETASQRPMVVLDAGTEAGLRPGMRLFAVNPRRPSFRADLTVVKSEEGSATARVDLQYHSIRVCDVWKSRLSASEETASSEDLADDRRVARCRSRSHSSRNSSRALPAASQVFLVGGDVLPPQPLYRPSPDFSHLRRRRPRPRGVPILEAVVSESGEVTGARMLRPVDPELDALLLETVQRWRFRPATRNARRVAVRYNVTFNIDWP